MYKFECQLQFKFKNVMNAMAGRDWVSLPAASASTMVPTNIASFPTQQTPHCSKHSSINLRHEHKCVEELNKILEDELAGASLKKQDIIDQIFTDDALGFEIRLLVHKLEALGAFQRSLMKVEAGIMLPQNYFHNHLRCNISSEGQTVAHLNHIIRALEGFLG